MPEIFRAYGFVFMFFSHEHEPIHVHVVGNGGDAKYVWDGKNGKDIFTERTMKIRKVWFEDDHLYGEGDDGKTYRQSLLWYPHLREATEEERNHYTISTIGIHWQNLNEDVSFESFSYDDAEPSAVQRFFLTHKEINVAEFARSMGMNPTLLRNYINGFKKPSKAREKQILDHIHKLGAEMLAA